LLLLYIVDLVKLLFSFFLFFSFHFMLPLMVNKVEYKTSHGAIVRRYLRDPMFSRFDTISECDGQTDRQIDRQTHTQTHDDGIYRA